jgi:hypothetical protein
MTTEITVIEKLLRAPSINCVKNNIQAQHANVKDIRAEIAKELGGGQGRNLECDCWTIQSHDREHRGKGGSRGDRTAGIEGGSRKQKNIPKTNIQASYATTAARGMRAMGNSALRIKPNPPCTA